MRRVHSKRRVASLQLPLAIPARPAASDLMEPHAQPRSRVRTVKEERRPQATVGRSGVERASAVESSEQTPAPVPSSRRAPLWLALRFNQLSVAAFESEPSPTACVEGGVVVAANRAARACNVHRGLTLSQAQWRCEALQIKPVDAQAMAQALDRLAFKAMRFSPWVSLEAPECVLLEIQGSLKLFGGLEALLSAVETAFAADHVHWAVAPFPLAAAWLSHQHARIALDQPTLRRQLDALRVDEFGAYSGERAWVSDLQRLGLKTLQQVRRLPRRGLKQRGGLEGLNRLDEAYGVAATPRRVWVEPLRFKSAWHGDDALWDAQAVRAVCARLLTELAVFLKKHSAGVSELYWRLGHRDGHVRWAWRLRDVSADPVYWLTVGGAGYFEKPLSGMIAQIELRSGRLRWVDQTHTLAGVEPLPADRERLWQQWLSHLQTRLGADAVVRRCVVSEHRPERAMREWRADLPLPSPANPTPATGRRPVWLLKTPKPLLIKNHKPWLGGPLTFIDGPERIQSGWWDQAPLARDYFTVQLAQGRRAWVFRELKSESAWYLHGWFG